MSTAVKEIAYGTAPWRQTSWDWRAAGNFICGGIGSGLIVFAACSEATGTTLALLLLAGIGFVGLGLASVALELGRPLRALNVFRNPRTSWMSREAIVGALLAPAVVASAAGLPELRWLAAVLAVAFMVCQGKLLQSAKGIPVWRERLLVPLFVITALAEGGGLFWITAVAHGAGSLRLLAAFAALLLVRALLWRSYRERVALAAPRASVALHGSGRAIVLAGTVVPLLLLAIGATAGMPYLPVLAAIAGAFGMAAGSFAKFNIVTRAAYNQGFRLAELPVRGARP